MSKSKDEQKIEGVIRKISGPVIVAEGLRGVKMNDVVRVGKEKLVGEVVELHGERVFIQVYEETAGIKPGEKVVSTGAPLSVMLGPGLVSSIFDGIQRPLDVVREKTGDFIRRGVEVNSLDSVKKWEFKPVLKEGDEVTGGTIIGEVQETAILTHKIMVPPGIEGKIEKIKSGEFTINEAVAVVSSKDGRHEITMVQKWPVRSKRPYLKKFAPREPLITGQRVIDAFFPIAKGGIASIPGPFGSGKTVVQQQLAKYSDAQIIIYIGCGERGNEMADVLQEFPELEDPNTGEPLIKRTVLIGNTSNMPVAAREASIYTGTAIGEYFRDMGYQVALMADSTSRWAEALREMSGRLEEMPGEEGYPAYLASRIAEFYERAGRVKCLGGDGREGSLSMVGAVSPPGGDLSDPVVKNTLRVVKVFWSLDDDLSSQRHFPAIHWLRSYSLYLDNITEYMTEKVGRDFMEIRKKAVSILQQEESLQEIVRLVGEESLSDKDRQVLDTAKMIREDFLQQSAFDPEETYTPIEQQYRMMKAIMDFYELSVEAIDEGKSFEDLSSLKVRERIARMKYIPADKLKEFDKIEEEIREQIKTAGGASRKESGV